MGAESLGGFVTWWGTQLGVLHAGVWAQAAWPKLPSQSVYIHSLRSKLLLFFFNFWLHPMVCGILVPPPEIEPMPLALEGRVLTTGLPQVPL